MPRYSLAEVALMATAAMAATTTSALLYRIHHLGVTRDEVLRDLGAETQRLAAAVRAVATVPKPPSQSSPTPPPA